MRCGALMTDLGVGRLALIVIDLQIGMFDGVKFPPLADAAPRLFRLRRSWRLHHFISRRGRFSD